MPRIFDNIEKSLLPALKETLSVANRADFCVGYFNLRGWKSLDSYIEKWAGGDGACCRLMVGMQKLPADDLKEALSLKQSDGKIDNQTVVKLKKKLAQEFREQLTYGLPTNEDEAGLKRLAKQIRAKKVVVKLFLQHQLHAKLYLLFRPDPVNPSIGFLGSSNLTFAGLSKQGELNIDVLDHDACTKLADWFKDRWNDHWCIDISNELAEIIETSWAREPLVPPYQIYIKMAYYLSQEARDGLLEFKIPDEFENKLFEFQKAAVKIVAHHIHKRGGVLIGDVVGLGKTLMATAVAKIFEDDFDYETLIVCPKNLMPMWEGYRIEYGLRAKVISATNAKRELADLKRHRLVIIDESHNLRNREGQRYKVIQEWIQKNDCKCILLSATPYNKTYLDLANQLRLFIPEDKDLGVRPEKLLRIMGETEFNRRHQCSIRSLAAFEKSEYPDDWRDLMRLYMVRRTRGFIQENYAETDPKNGRRFLTFSDGSRSYFPERKPKTLKFKIKDKDPNDQYAKLYSEDIVQEINRLNLPRYGLGNYIVPSLHTAPTQAEAAILQDLSRAGKHLMGFCRTNLFKRLESSGFVFLESIKRHILRNFICLYAIENSLPVPIGKQDVGLLDTRIFDGDSDQGGLFDEDDDESGKETKEVTKFISEVEFKKHAARVYKEYATQFKKRFKWLRSDLFKKELGKSLQVDAEILIKMVVKCGEWQPHNDAKLKDLFDLLTNRHGKEKVIVFTQFADTVYYLEEQLKKMGLKKISGVTGDSANPTDLAWHFSPKSNDRYYPQEEELRILIATDVLSEGQNLQDSAIVVNYDLPWAIIRLIQRAGRVDRIGQKAEKILCYSFLPADGVEQIIQLRERVRQRLRENAEVVGTDEFFFEDDHDNKTILDLYHEKAGILDGDVDNEVDLASYAWQIWKNATNKNPELEKIIPELPPVVYSTRSHKSQKEQPEGVLVYVRTAQSNDALAWIDKSGKSVTESQLAILKAAECKPETNALPRHEDHHTLVSQGVELILKEEKTVGGQLGRPSGARFRTYERLKRYAEEMKDTLFAPPELGKAIDEIYRYPLKQAATDVLNRQLRSGISDGDLAQLVLLMRDEERLSQIQNENESGEPKIICSLGLFSKS